MFPHFISLRSNSSDNIPREVNVRVRRDDHNKKPPDDDDDGHDEPSATTSSSALYAHRASFMMSNERTKNDDLQIT